MGRSALIRKRRLIALGLASGALAALLMLGALSAGAHLAGITAHEVGVALAPICPWWLAAAALPALGILLRCAPGPDLPSLASVLLLGPITALRPVILVAGVGVCVLFATQWAPVVPILVAATAALTSDVVLGACCQHLRGDEDRRHTGQEFG